VPPWACSRRGGHGAHNILHANFSRRETPHFPWKTQCPHQFGANRCHPTTQKRRVFPLGLHVRIVKPPNCLGYVSAASARYPGTRSQVREYLRALRVLRGLRFFRTVARPTLRFVLRMLPLRVLAASVVQLAWKTSYSGCRRVLFQTPLSMKNCAKQKQYSSDRTPSRKRAANHFLIPDLCPLPQ
jgi:hypothetical protein